MTSQQTISKQPLSAAERKRLQRARAKEAGMPNYEQSVSAVANAAIDIGQGNGTVEALSQLAVRYLETKGFDRSRSAEAIRKLTEAGGMK